MKQFFSNGKLLISGEYVVLDEAVSLAVPTKYGQSLMVENIDEPRLIWQSLDEKGIIWFEAEFGLIKDEILCSYDDEVSKRLLQILRAAKNLNNNFLKDGLGYKVTTKLDFPKNWGLGTSSTLINNIANWAKVDPYVLLKETFGGSGYDIACAQNDSAITYKLNGSLKEVLPVNFDPKFKEHLYFVHLNKKQNSRDGIKHYREHKGDLLASIKKVNRISQEMIDCESLESFIKLMKTHEAIIAGITKQTPVKEKLFSDFKGAIKSLGAWGGDFILAASNENVAAYFKGKGFDTVIPYQDMVL